MFQYIIHSIQDRIQKFPLPGLVAQLYMAPKGRNFSIPQGNVMEAAVLILLFQRNGEIYLCLIKRPDYEGHHSGQVSFPGGKMDATDGSAMETALRETWEEIGIPVNKPKVLGKLTDLYIPVSNFLVHPFLASLDEIPDYRTDPNEVKFLIEMSVTDLLNPSSVNQKVISIRDSPVVVPYYSIQNEEIWGATAMILSELAALLQPIYSDYQQSL